MISWELSEFLARLQPGVGEMRALSSELEEFLVEVCVKGGGLPDGWEAMGDLGRLRLARSKVGELLTGEDREGVGEKMEMEERVREWVELSELHMRHHWDYEESLSLQLKSKASMVDRLADLVEASKREREVCLNASLSVHQFTCWFACSFACLHFGPSASLFARLLVTRQSRPMMCWRSRLPGGRADRGGLGQHANGDAAEARFVRPVEQTSLRKAFIRRHRAAGAEQTTELAPGRGVRVMEGLIAQSGAHAAMGTLDGAYEEA